MKLGKGRLSLVIGTTPSSVVLGKTCDGKGPRKMCVRNGSLFNCRDTLCDRRDTLCDWRAFYWGWSISSNRRCSASESNRCEESEEQNGHHRAVHREECGVMSEQVKTGPNISQ
ncbi:hypothetical protein H4582DRAFT_1933938 [Lactarius indigo]|nr:hypothetical protein H4582DRAFT_1933938 [Lactarius indigo]